MIGLDTNVLLRYVVQDDERQAAAATRFVETKLSERNPGFVSLIVLVEFVWVLEKIYGHSESAVAATVKRLLQIESLVIEDRQDVFTAVSAVEDRRGAFVDALIAARGLTEGCAVTVTFDRRALRIPGFAAL